mgnify:CR=1 FL=1
MKKRNLFIIVAVLTFVSIFSLIASANFGNTYTKQSKIESILTWEKSDNLFQTCSFSGGRLNSACSSLSGDAVLSWSNSCPMMWHGKGCWKSSACSLSWSSCWMHLSNWSGCHSTSNSSWRWCCKN